MMKYTYDDTGQMRSMTDPNNNVTQYDYTDSFPPGNTNAYLTKITYPNTGVAHTESFSYNYPDGQLSSSTDQNGQKTSYFYDEGGDQLDRLTGINYPDCVAQGGCNVGHSVSYSYDDAGPSPDVLITKKLSVSGSPGPYLSTTVMDGVGYVTQAQVNSDPAGEDDTDTTYDGEGRVWKQSNPHRSAQSPSDGTTIYTYDAIGRVTNVQRPDNNTVTTAYSSNCATVTDEQSRARKSCADGLGRTTQVFEDPSGLNYETDYQYDALDNLIAVTQGSQKPCLNNTVSRSFVYDSLSRLASACTPESGTTTYTYDANGNVLTRKDARGITTTYQYDALNRLTWKTYSDGTLPVNFAYDRVNITMNTTLIPVSNGIGRLGVTCVESANTCVAMDGYSYDVMGRIIDHWQCTPYNCNGTPPNWDTHYDFDLAGDVKDWTHPAGFTITNSINAAQQVTQITESPYDSRHPQYIATSIGYTPFGALQTLVEGCYGTGQNQGCTEAQETHDYNNRLQPVRIQLGTSGVSNTDSCLVYNYYAGTGNPTGCAIPAQASSGNNGIVMGYLYQDSANPSLGHTASYAYDSLNRLTSAVASGSSAYNLTFVYNQDSSGRYGNMSCQTNGQTQGLCTNVSFNPGNNQISTAGYAYDAAGNLTQDITSFPTMNYQYDAEGRLTTVSQGGNPFANLVYNAHGQAVSIVYPVYSNTKVDGVFDPAGRELGYYDGAAGGWYDQDIWAAGRMIAQAFPASFSGGLTQFLHANALGSDAQITNQTGAVAYDILYYPWGQYWTHTGRQGDTHFAGFQQSGEPFGYLTPTRHYRGTLGRWMTPDPLAGDISNPQSLNRYAYALNNPTTNTDPTGLFMHRPPPQLPWNVYLYLLDYTPSSRPIDDGEQIAKHGPGDALPFSLAKYRKCCQEAFGKNTAQTSNGTISFAESVDIVNASAETGESAAIIGATLLGESSGRANQQTEPNYSGSSGRLLSVDVGPMQLNVSPGNPYGWPSAALGTNLTPGQHFNGDLYQNILAGAGYLATLGSHPERYVGKANSQGRLDLINELKPSLTKFFNCLTKP